jgi:hypothetical protein
VACFAHLIGGLTNAGLCQLMGQLLGGPYTSRHATYDLRRLRRKGLICRVEGRNLYRVTPHGRAVATFFTTLSARVVVPVLSELERPLVPGGATSLPIVAAWHNYERELEAFIEEIAA